MDPPDRGAARTGPERVATNNNSSLAPGSALPRLAVPRYDQRLYSSSISDRDSHIETMSHVHTDSQHGANNNPAGSVYSYNSTRDVATFLREAHGRIFSNLNDFYLLPTDDAEWGRLDKQHSAILISMDGLTPCAEIVDTILAPDGGEPKQVLDIGCGTGSWAIEMAMRFPNVLVKGVDVSPIPLDTSIFPPNLSFELDDVNYGLTHFHDQFDLIHMRCVSTGLTDVDATVKELQRCLKPGGLLLLVDGDIEFRHGEGREKMKMKRLDGDDEDATSVSEDGSWVQRLVWEAHEASRFSGAVNGRVSELIDCGLWDQELCDPKTAAAGGVLLPIGPWAQASDPIGTQALKYVGMLMRQAFIHLHRAFHPSIRKYGVPQTMLDQWSKECDKELESMEPPMWVRFRFCWARRRAGPDLPAPPLSTLATITNTDGSGPTSSYQRRYPAFEVFYTPEEARSAREKRRESNGVWPISVVDRARTGLLSTV